MSDAPIRISFEHSRTQIVTLDSITSATVGAASRARMWRFRRTRRPAPCSMTMIRATMAKATKGPVAKTPVIARTRAVTFCTFESMCNITLAFLRTLSCVLNFRYPHVHSDGFEPARTQRKTHVTAHVWPCLCNDDASPFGAKICGTVCDTYMSRAAISQYRTVEGTANCMESRRLAPSFRFASPCGDHSRRN